jgi:hypothetical protein
MNSGVNVLPFVPVTSIDNRRANRARIKSRRIPSSGTSVQAARRHVLVWLSAMSSTREQTPWS